jgi:hypothetical protein
MIIKGRNIWPQDLEHLAEQQPEVRPTDSSAFSITDADDEEMAVLVVQTRESDPNKLALLADRLQEKIHAEFGIQCLISWSRRTLPRTSGKLAQLGAQGVRRAPAPRRRRIPTCFISDDDLSSPWRARREHPDGRRLRPGRMEACPRGRAGRAHGPRPDPPGAEARRRRHLAAEAASTGRGDGPGDGDQSPDLDSGGDPVPGPHHPGAMLRHPQPES